MNQLLETLLSSSSIPALEIVARLLLSFLLTSAVAAIYTRTYRGYGRPSQLALVLVLVGLAVAGIIMAIGDNWALSLGLVGALSIVRFRTAIKDQRDLAYIFWAIAIGLVAGAGNYLLVLILCGFIGLVVAIIEGLGLYRGQARQHIVIVSRLRAADAATPAKPPGLSAGASLRSSVYHREEGVEESTYLVELSDDSAVEALKTKLVGDELVTSYQVLGPDDALLG